MHFVPTSISGSILYPMPAGKNANPEVAIHNPSEKVPAEGSSDDNPYLEVYV